MSYTPGPVEAPERCEECGGKECCNEFCDCPDCADAPWHTGREVAEDE